MSRAIALVCGLAYCALMIYGSVQFVDRLMTLGNDARDIPLPRWVLTGVMPIAFGCSRCGSCKLRARAVAARKADAAR